ncbi:Rhodanese-like domain-containing protein [Mycena pura]|uniref:Rhodanese-like domain-containing protein n=1 Tax=Mycena pura TaxID=153505 RepID=A0AAD6Y0F7_9AGAR|nr:Rhodanese-like domain-containing protein [Mycena pura]
MSTSTDWHAAFPTPTATPDLISAEDLAVIIREKQIMKDYIVVDVRRTDFEDASIVGCLNLPAHSFYPTLSTILAVLGEVPEVVFHCNSCKTGSRGQRAAGWYQDALNASGGGAKSRALVLDGGIRRWIEVYGQNESLTKKL